MEAGAINVLLNFFLGLRPEGQEEITPEIARDTAALLAGKAFAKLHAGIDPEYVVAAWAGRIATTEPSRVTSQLVRDAGMTQMLTWLFNAYCPVGKEVYVLRDDGSRVRAKTRSACWLEENGQPVVMVTGIAGYYLLTRVVPVEAVDCEPYMIEPERREN
jgi:hypothetical protein